MRRLSYWWLAPFILLNSCAILKDSFPLASPSSGGDQTIGFRFETGSNNDVMVEDGSAGGVVGRIGGNGDSIALWITIAILGVVAISAYPAQRGMRLAWNSWRGTSGPKKMTRSRTGKTVCLKTSEWGS